MLRPRRMRAKPKRLTAGGLVNRPITLRLDTEQVWKGLLEIKKRRGE